mgnify:CR=1 FL=1|tara:strand:- start:38383 stop:38898 length:516 start_codon:yes stop_codon:yes gene_type:complete
MKTLKYISTVLALFCILVTADAQTFSEQSEPEIESFQSNASALSFIASQNQQAASQTTSGSSVFINQVGENNDAQIDVQARNSLINIFQSGMSNLTLIDVSAFEITQNITQNGEENRFYNFSSNPSALQNMEVIQNGVNQDITVFGENSLSENMKINMQGNDRSLVIRNFN